MTDDETIDKLDEKLKQAGKLLSGGKPGEAEVLCIEILNKDAHHAPALMMRSQIAFGYGKLDLATEFLRRSMMVNPDQPGGWLTLAQAYRDLARHDDAEDALRKLLEQEPENAQALIQTGIEQILIGHLDEAENLLRRGIDADPHQGLGYISLVAAVALGTGDKVMTRMQKLVEAGEVTLDDRVLIAQALASALCEQGKTEEFWQALIHANGLQLGLRDMSIKSYETLFDRMKKTFDAEFVQQRALISRAPFVPVFIVGLPGAGTPYLENLLAGHSQITSAGALPFIRNRIAGGIQAVTADIYPEAIRKLNLEALTDLSADYYRSLLSRVGQSAYVLDVNASNFQALGLIYKLFPNARVLNVTREPMANGFECLKSYDPGNEIFTIDMEAFAGYARLYNDLMSYWRTVTPNFIFNVSFEALAEDPAKQIKRVLKFLGLKYEKACLEDHGRPIRTTSLMQARQPLSVNLIDAWKRHEKNLAPLKKALKAEGLI